MICLPLDFLEALRHVCDSGIGHGSIRALTIQRRRVSRKKLKSSPVKMESFVTSARFDASANVSQISLEAATRKVIWSSNTVQQEAEISSRATQCVVLLSSADYNDAGTRRLASRDRPNDCS